MSKHVEELRAKYIANPPEGMTSDDVRNMPDDALLDMDYFLMKTNLMMMNLVKKFFFSSNPFVFFFYLLLSRHFYF